MASLLLLWGWALLVIVYKTPSRTTTVASKLELKEKAFRLHSCQSHGFLTQWQRQIMTWISPNDWQTQVERRIRIPKRTLFRKLKIEVWDQESRVMDAISDHSSHQSKEMLTLSLPLARVSLSSSNRWYTLFQKSIFSPKTHSNKLNRKKLSRVTYFLQIRVVQIFQISKIQGYFWDKN